MADNGFKVNKSLNLNPQSGQPANPIDGDVYYDSTSGTFAYYHSNVWANMDSIGDVTTIANMTSAQFTPSIMVNSVVRLTGAGGNVHGLASSFSAKKVIFYNNTSGNVFLKYESATEATVNNRIRTPTGADMTLIAGEIAQFMYDVVQNRWLLVSISSLASSQIPATTTNMGIVKLHQASLTPTDPVVLSDGDLNTANGVVGLTANRVAVITALGASNATGLTVTGDGAGHGATISAGATGIGLRAFGGASQPAIQGTGSIFGSGVSLVNIAAILSTKFQGAGVVGLVSLQAFGVVGEGRLAAAGVAGFGTQTTGFAPGVFGYGSIDDGDGVYGLGGGGNGYGLRGLGGNVNGGGVLGTGVGVGFGGTFIGGATGTGLSATGGTSGGNGATFIGTFGTTHGAIGQGAAGGGNGFVGTGGNGVGGHGIVGFGGTSTFCIGVVGWAGGAGTLGASAAVTDNVGMYGVGRGAGHGVLGVSGPTANAIGGVFYGDNTGATTHGVKGIGGGFGDGVWGVGGVSGGPGVYGIGGGTTNGTGGLFDGIGAGSGIEAYGGDAATGSTSGSAVIGYGGSPTAININAGIGGLFWAGVPFGGTGKGTPALMAMGAGSLTSSAYAGTSVATFISIAPGATLDLSGRASETAGGVFLGAGTAAGIYAVSGAGASAAGIHGAAQAGSNGYGVFGRGVGTGVGTVGIGDATTTISGAGVTPAGYGGLFIGASGTGMGLYALGQGTGVGAYVQGGATGNGMTIATVGASNTALSISVGSAGRAIDVDQTSTNTLVHFKNAGAGTTLFAESSAGTAIEGRSTVAAGTGVYGVGHYALNALASGSGGIGVVVRTAVASIFAGVDVTPNTGQTVGRGINLAAGTGAMTYGIVIDDATNGMQISGATAGITVNCSAVGLDVVTAGATSINTNKRIIVGTGTSTFGGAATFAGNVQGTNFTATSGTSAFQGITGTFCTLSSQLTVNSTIDTDFLDVDCQGGLGSGNAGFFTDQQTTRTDYKFGWFAWHVGDPGVLSDVAAYLFIKDDGGIRKLYFRNNTGMHGPIAG